MGNRTSPSEIAGRRAERIAGPGLHLGTSVVRSHQTGEASYPVLATAGAGINCARKAFRSCRFVRSAKDVRRAREQQRERWRRLHGGWPGDDESPAVFETSDGNRGPDLREDLALVAAVEGVQRIRTWAALEAKRLTNGSQFEADRNRKVRDTPLRRAQTILVGRFASLYPRLFGRKFGVSKLAPTKSGKSAGSVGGPGREIRASVSRPTRGRMSAYAIEKTWDTNRSDLRDMGNKALK